MMAVEILEERIERVLRDAISIAPYSSAWPQRFEQEKQHLLECLPETLILRVEHFGSTAIPGMSAKPIVDMLVEVASLEQTRQRITPVLEGQGYEYFWRPEGGDDGPPFYAWFIKRDAAGARTHHIHMVEGDSRLWEGLDFRDYLRGHSDAARDYERLKLRLAAEYPGDRVAYTNGKTEFVMRLTRLAGQGAQAGQGW